MRILVTGGAGFIGSWVSERLLDRGDEVVVVDNFDPFYDRRSKERGIETLAGRAGFDLMEADIADSPTLKRALSGVDRVVHLAALAGVRPSILQPARYMQVNVEGTVRVLEACRETGVRHVVVASSSSVYGKRSQTPFSECDPCDRPASPYAASKRATELVCANYNELFDIGITCLRYFTVFGPRQRPEMAIHKFVRLALHGHPIPLFGDGTSGRDYTYIDDIVNGTLAALDRQDEAFHIYNLGGAQPVTLSKLIDAISEAIDTKVAISPQPWQPGDVPVTSADIRLAERDLGYAPQVSLQEGLRRFVLWYRKNMLARA